MENTLSIPVALLAQGSIRIDGITYYRHGNKVRACKSRRSPKKTRTEGEEESSSRFTEARKMWRIYRRAIGDLPIWKLMAKEMGINKSDSLFHSQNGGCFRPGEGVCGGHFHNPEPQAALCLRHGGNHSHQRRVGQEKRKYCLQVFQELL